MEIGHSNHALYNSSSYSSSTHSSGTSASLSPLAPVSPSDAANAKNTANSVPAVSSSPTVAVLNPHHSTNINTDSTAQSGAQTSSASSSSSSSSQSSTEADTQNSSDSTPTKEEVLSSAGLTPVEAAQVEELQTIDNEVRLHELAHAAVGGAHAGGIQLEYTRGPDGRMYATSGEVSIDTSSVPGDPEATIDKMRTVIAAAMAPAEPSSQDHRVAAQASAIMVQAQAEMADVSRGDAAAGEDNSDSSGEPSSDSPSELSKESSAEKSEAVAEDEENQMEDDERAAYQAQVKENMIDFNRRLVDSGAFQPVFDLGTLVHTQA